MSTAPRDPQTKRYAQLVNWLWELGCCWRCRAALAAAQLEREATGAKDITTQLQCETVEECRDAAKRSWKSMPAVPPP